MNLSTESFGPIRRLLAVGGIALAGSVALTGCGILEDAASDSATDNEVSGEQVDAVAEAAAGDCLPEAMLGADTSTFAVPCDDPTAFWSITAIEADPGLTATSDGGSLTDPQPIFDMCGEEVGAQVPGATWTDWSMVYDQTTFAVDYIFCVEALGVPSSWAPRRSCPQRRRVLQLHGRRVPVRHPACDSPDVDSTSSTSSRSTPAEWTAADANAEAIAASAPATHCVPARSRPVRPHRRRLLPRVTAT